MGIPSYFSYIVKNYPEIIKKYIPCKITPSTDKDIVQFNKRNEPDPYVLTFWKPNISLKEGIGRIIGSMYN